MNSPLLRIARTAIEAQMAGEDPRRTLAQTANSAPQGCFVSLKKRARLRGCMGTMAPTRASLEEEVLENALAAALRDPRFEPLRTDEVGQLHISIDLLSPMEEVLSENDLDPSRFGLLIKAGSLHGVLLPDLPGVTTVQRQIEICREKAGIAPGKAVTMQRFQVERIFE